MYSALLLLVLSVHTVQVRTLLGYTKTFEDPSDYAHMAMPDKATKSETEFSEL